MAMRTLLAVPAAGLTVLLAVTSCAGRAGNTPAEPAPPTTGAATAGPSDPAKPSPERTDTWRMLAAAPVPAAWDYSGVWTGTELLLYGYVYSAEAETKTFTAAYNPATNTWRRPPSCPYPVLNIEGGHRVVWTGTEMLVFGVTNASFNPRTNTWRPLPPGSSGASAAVWTGRQALLWGGGCCGENSNDGKEFDPATNTWRAMPRAPIAGRHAGGVWTGTELLVIGGTNDDGLLADGAAYNPQTRTWRTVAAMPAPRVGASMTWTGTDVVLVGGLTYKGSVRVYHRDGLAYNPTTNRWRKLPDMPTAREGHMAVWTGRQLLVWGGMTAQSVVPAHGVAYTPDTNQWTPMHPSPLSGRDGAVAVWTGQEMIIWGGAAARPPNQQLHDGAAYRPAG
jgi:N-acetylneuraminic acid mutarotase